MQNNPNTRRWIWWTVCTMAILFYSGAALGAPDMSKAPDADKTAAQHETAKPRINGLTAIGAGLAIGLAALATGLAQAKIGAAGMGAIAEDPKRLGSVIMLVAIPETVAILGFVVAYLMIS